MSDLVVRGEHERQHENWQRANERLWGSPMPRPIVLPAYVRPLEPPEPDAPVVLPRPSQEQLDALLDAADDRAWQAGFKFILSSFGENMRRLISLQRDQHIVDCRVAIAKYLRSRGWSYPRIGQVMHRDHSSIVHLLEPQRKRDAYLKRQAESVKKQRVRRKKAETLKGAGLTLTLS